MVLISLASCSRNALALIKKPGKFRSKFCVIDTLRMEVKRSPYLLAGLIIDLIRIKRYTEVEVLLVAGKTQNIFLSLIPQRLCKFAFISSSCHPQLRGRSIFGNYGFNYIF